MLSPSMYNDRNRARGSQIWIVDQNQTVPQGPRMKRPRIYFFKSNYLNLFNDGVRPVEIAIHSIHKSLVLFRPSSGILLDGPMHHRLSRWVYWKVTYIISFQKSREFYLSSTQKETSIPNKLDKLESIPPSQAILRPCTFVIGTWAINSWADSGFGCKSQFVCSNLSKIRQAFYTYHPCIKTCKFHTYPVSKEESINTYTSKNYTCLTLVL
jgi:hypothetical protein